MSDPTALEFLRWDEEASLDDLRDMGEDNAINEASDIAGTHGLRFGSRELRDAFRQLARETDDE